MVRINISNAAEEPLRYLELPRVARRWVDGVLKLNAEFLECSRPFTCLTGCAAKLRNHILARRSDFAGPREGVRSGLSEKQKWSFNGCELPVQEPVAWQKHALGLTS